MKRKRSELGLERKEMVRRLGTATDSMRNWETGRTAVHSRLPAIILGYKPLPEATSEEEAVADLTTNPKVTPPMKTVDRFRASSAVVPLFRGLAVFVCLSSCESGNGNSHPATIRSVSLVHVGSIGKGLGVFAPKERANFAELSDGNLVITPLYEPGVVGLFNLRGERLGVIGSKGQGPKEFSSPRYVAEDDQKNLHILDTENGRIAVWSKDRTLIRTVPVRQPAIRSWPVGDSEYVLQRLVSDGDNESTSLIVIDKHGDIKRNFGPRRDEFLNSFTSAIAPDRTIWVLAYNEYRVLHYDRNGAILGVITSDRFPRFSRQGALKRVLSMKTLTVGYGIAVLPTGEVAVLQGHVKWGRFKRRNGSHVPEEGIRERSRVATFTLDVWDQASGKLIGEREELNKFFIGFTNTGDLIQATELDSGIVVFDLWRVEIT